MNLDIDRVIELFFPHKCEFLYRLGLDGILVCFAAPLWISPQVNLTI